MTHVYTGEMGSLGNPTPRRPNRACGIDHCLRVLKPEILALVQSILDNGAIEIGLHVAALAREFQQCGDSPPKKSEPPIVSIAIERT